MEFTTTNRMLPSVSRSYLTDLMNAMIGRFQSAYFFDENLPFDSVIGFMRAEQGEEVVMSRLPKRLTDQILYEPRFAGHLDRLRRQVLYASCKDDKVVEGFPYEPNMLFMYDRLEQVKSKPGVPGGEVVKITIDTTTMRMVAVGKIVCTDIKEGYFDGWEIKLEDNPGPGIITHATEDDLEMVLS